MSMQAIIGSEALAAGLLTRGQLRWRYRAVFPDVYLPRDVEPTVAEFAYAAWLWSGRTGVITGLTAASLHGVSWIDAGAPVEILTARRTSIPGLLARNHRFERDEVAESPSGLLIATPPRVALDIARLHPPEEAVPHLDALVAATGVSIIQVANLLHRYRGAPGTDSARGALQVMDGGARSKRESLLRLAMIEAGLPRPATAIYVSDGIKAAVVPLGWERYRVGLTLTETDGPVPQNPWKQLKRNNILQLQGWINLFVSENEPIRTTTYAVREAILVQRKRGL